MQITWNYTIKPCVLFNVDLVMEKHWCVCVLSCWISSSCTEQWYSVCSGCSAQIDTQGATDSSSCSDSFSQCGCVSSSSSSSCSVCAIAMQTSVRWRELTIATKVCPLPEKYKPVPSLHKRARSVQILKKTCWFLSRSCDTSEHMWSVRRI